MVKFNYKRFEKDTYKLDKNKLIQLYLYMHSNDKEIEELKQSQRIRIIAIIKHILKEKYDVQLMDVIAGGTHGLH